MEYKLNQSLSQQNRFEVSAIQTRFWGLEIEQLKLKNSLNQQEWIKLDRFRIWFDLGSILLSQELPFDFQLYGGSGSGTLGLFPSPKITVKIADLEPNWIPFIRQTRLVLSKPLLNLDGQVMLNTLATEIRMTIKDLKVTGNKLYTNLLLDLPDTTLTTVATKMALKQNQLDVSVETTGDINSVVAGKIVINRKRVQRSRFNLTLTADLAKPYQANLGVLNSIISNYGNKTGKISIRLTGNLNSPKIKKI